MPGGETSSSFVFRLGRPAGGVSVAVGSSARRSLAGLVDVRVDVLGGGQLGDTRLGLLVSHLGSCRGEVLIALDRTHSQSMVSQGQNNDVNSQKAKTQNNELMHSLPAS